MRPQPRSDDVILERWRVELGETPNRPPADLGSILPTVYKKSIVLFRSLFTYSKFLPAWKFAKRNLKIRPNPALRIKYRILEGSGTHEGSEKDHLTVPLYEGNGRVVDTYSFGVTESPAGPFSVQVTYRTSCDFRVDDSEALLSSRFMGADDEIFRPSLPSGNLDRPHTETGSVPVDKLTVEYPDCTRAYGSLSSFHQIGPTTGASPISALRAAQEVAATSPTPSDSSSRKIMPPGKISPVGRAAVLAGEGTAVGRRPSISFQPFKAPPLSASPSLVDSPLGASPRPGSSRPPTSDSKNMPPPAIPASTRRPVSTAADNAIASSNSASPRPAPPIARYSSAFGHRRGRHSGGANRIEDDNSSGKASAASSAAQPGSGLLAEAPGTSAESIHADDENISAFLKMLDSRKDLLNPENSSVLDATRKTTALTRFQRMRDSNAALSDSMSSSLVLQRSSNSSSKQLSGVPPMVAGTSASTASSPGKPVSPHTPHTPAIPSRLSSNSIVDYNEEGRPHRMSHDEHDSPIEEDASEEALDRAQSTAIDIPTSPRIPPGTFRRPSSAAPRRTIPAADDDEIFPFGMRSVSLGNEDRSHLSLSALLRQQELESAAANQSRRGPRHSDDPTVSSASATDPYREVRSQKGAPSSGPTATSSSSNHHLYQPRFGHYRGRGSSGGPHSMSSASSSLARGPAVPAHLAERDYDRDGNGSGSNSGNSTIEARRGSGQRSSSARTHPPQAMAVDDEEPLLFTMSDFGVSRRSLEEGRHGQGHGATDSSGNTSGSRRGSGRRGGTFPGFHVWS